VPHEWATIQSNLCTALERLGQRESETAKLEEAVAACREALKERCSRTPFSGNHMSWQKRFGSRPLSWLAIVVTLVAQPASAQLVGSRSVQATGCASAAVGGDVRDTSITTVCGMPSEQIVELVRLAASPQAGDRAELMARLSALVPASGQLHVEAIAKFFQLLGEAPVEESQLADRFAQIAAEHRRLVEDVKSLRVNDPEVQGRSFETSCDPTDRPASRNLTGNLFALLKLQRRHSSATRRWSDPSIESHDPLDAGLVPPFQRPGDG
jgi:hypothetical protein